MSLRVIFMGTPDFAVPTLTEIIGQGHEVVSCYTRAPAQAGRGLELKPSPVHRAAERFGSQCIVVAIDARAAGEGRWEVYTHGGRKPTGLDAVEWARRVVELGAGELLVTSMDTDGHLDGYDIPLTRAISEAVEVPVIASGGAGNPQHMVEAVTEGKADAVLAASIFHYGTHRIRDCKRYMAEHGVPVRL